MNRDTSAVSRLVTYEGSPVPFVDGRLTHREARELCCEFGSPGSAPWLAGALRETYERVIPPFWPLLERSLRRTHGGRLPTPLDGDEVVRHLPLAIGAFADQTSSADQRALLYAMGTLFVEEAGPVDPNCSCAYCGPAHSWQRRQRRSWAGDPLRAAFMLLLGVHFQVVQKAPTQYDHQHGVPAVSWNTGPGRHGFLPSATSRPTVHKSRHRHAGRAAAPAQAPAFGSAAGQGICPPRQRGAGFDTAAEGTHFGVSEALHRTVFGPAWQLLARNASPIDTATRTYDVYEIARHSEGVALHVACAVTTAADQRVYLDATDGADEFELPYGDGAACWLCAVELNGRGSRARARAGSRGRVRHAFAHRLWDHMEYGLALRDPLDVELGMPLIVQHPLDRYLDQLQDAAGAERTPTPLRSRQDCGWDQRTRPPAA